MTCFLSLGLRGAVAGVAALSACALFTQGATAQVAGPYVNTTTGNYNSGCPAGGPTLATPGDLRQTINVDESFLIGDLDVGIRVNHAFRLDSEVWIIAPSGTRERLLIGPAPNNAVDDYNVRFDQSAATVVNTGIDENRDHSSTAAPFQFTLRPEAPGTLNSFNNQQANGNWHVDFCDNFAGADPGSVNRVELFFTEAVPATNADLSLRLDAAAQSPTTGANTFFDVSVTNSGPLATAGVTANVNLPAGLTYQSDDSGGDFNSATGQWTIGALTNGATETLRIIVRVETTGSYALTSEVTASAVGDPDSTPGNGVGANEDDDDAVTLTPAAPPPPLYCLGRPVQPLAFMNPVLVSGTDLQVGARYRFANVSPGVDALVDVTAFNNGAGLGTIDNAGAGLADNFQPTITGPAGDVSVDFGITLVQSGTTTAGTLDFAGSVIDVDGNNGGLREYVEVSDNIVEFALNNPTRLITQANTPPDPGASAPSAIDRVRFEAATSDVAPGIDPTEPRNIATAFFTDVSTFEYRAGKFGDATTGRLNSLAFNCPTLTTPTPNPAADEDFGDAPSSYGNPIHTIATGVRLGATNTAETGPGNSPTASSDAGDDGVTLPASFLTGNASNVTVNVTGASGRLQAFFDWNGDGDFADSGEQVVANETDGDADGTITLSISPPLTATAGDSFARFRWSTASDVGIEDAAGDGEVEDYQITIAAGSAQLDGAKTTYVFDPFADGLYALPGNDVVYEITVSNSGDVATDTDTIFLVDRIPSEVEFWNGDIDQSADVAVTGEPDTYAGSDPVGFSQANGAALTFNYAADVAFSTAATAPTDFGDCTAVVPDNTYRPDLTFICFNPKGSLAQGSPDPEFTVSFRGRIR